MTKTTIVIIIIIIIIIKSNSIIYFNVLYQQPNGQLQKQHRQRNRKNEIDSEKNVTKITS
jgi:uncharacterized protein YxeA